MNNLKKQFKKSYAYVYIIQAQTIFITYISDTLWTMDKTRRNSLLQCQFHVNEQVMLDFSLVVLREQRRNFIQT